MQVQNKGQKNAELNIGGKIIHSDENGVYDVDDVIGARLLGLPGFHKPKMTVELQTAYAEHRVATEALKEAQAKYDVTKLAVATAQVQADRGQGTPLGEEAPAASSKPTKAKTPSTPTPKAADPQEDDEGEDDEAEEKEDDRATTATDAATAAKLKTKFGTPSMRWKSDDLIAYANAIGVEADTEWSKADILKAIEDNEEE